MALSFQAKYNGKCQAVSCTKGGKITIGDYITWDRKRKGVAYHVECFGNESKLPEMPELPETPNESKITIGDFKSPTFDWIPPVSPVDIDVLEVTSNDDADLAKELADVLKRHQPKAPKIDESYIISLIEKYSKSERVINVTLTDSKAPEIVKDFGVQHKSFPLLLKSLMARKSSGHRLNIWLAGPAGSGKTTAAQNVAEALGLPFYFTGAVANEYALSGYMDAHGKYVETQFYHCCMNGGVFLWDEVDASSANALLWANAPLANGMVAFPNSEKPVKIHPDCVFIACANTWGLGANSEYVGRTKIDAAFLNRFGVKMSWDYDEALETALSGNIGWSQRVQAVRRKIVAKGLKIIISPRQTIEGACLLASGLTLEEVELLTLRSGMTDDQWESVR